MHIGGGVSVRPADILALIDLQRPLSADTGALLDRLKSAGRVRVLHDPPKTLVLTGSQAYLTGTGLRTLVQRFPETRHLSSDIIKGH